MDNDKLDIEKLEKKLKKIKRRNQKDNYYNYKNIELLTTIHENDVILPPSQPDISQLSFSISSPEIDSYNRHSLMNHSILNNTKPNVNLDSEKILGKNNIIDKISDYYHYYFPIKEGATSNSEPQQLDPMNIKFWNLPCDFLSIDFYTDLIAKVIRSLDNYDNDPNDTNFKNDKALIKSFFDQMIMIIVAFIMTFNVYYFVFMYNWDCCHGNYVPGYGIHFKGQFGTIVNFVIRDVRVPVFLCSYIYTYLYPSIFKLLQVSKYKRLSFLFIFLFMLCFVFITGQSISVSMHSFITNGKISPVVLLIVLVSVFIGIFFSKNAEAHTRLHTGLNKKCSEEGTIHANIIAFNIEEGKAWEDNKPFFYSMIEKLDYYKSILDYDSSLLKKDKENFKKIVDDLEKKLTEIEQSKGKNQEESVLDIPQMDPPSPLESSMIYIIIMAIIRFIIAFACLPLAQICVAWFFFYTTSGIGLLLNEGISGFRRVYYHINDNNGEHENYSINEFYQSVNNTPFFKFLINEIFLLTIYIIYAIVKMCTMPIQASKLYIKLASVIFPGILLLLLVIALYVTFITRNIPQPITNDYSQIDQTGELDIGSITDQYPDTNPEGFDETTIGSNPNTKGMNSDEGKSSEDVLSPEDVLPEIEESFETKNDNNIGFNENISGVNPLSLKNNLSKKQIEENVNNNVNNNVKKTLIDSVSNFSQNVFRKKNISNDNFTDLTKVKTDDYKDIVDGDPKNLNYTFEQENPMKKRVINL